MQTQIKSRQKVYCLGEIRQKSKLNRQKKFRVYMWPPSYAMEYYFS